ncbi:MAG: HAD family hydrolase [Alphaproteobacteria bacterium]|nr:HAD family hydrolase [Alphaproteobacteria bacterium]
MIRLLCFDLDDTLIDRRGALRRALAADFTAAELRWLEAADGATFAEAAAARFPERVPDGDALPARIAAAVTPTIGVASMLQQLRLRFTLALVSDGGAANQREKLRRAGLAGAFDAVFISGERGVTKPALLGLALGELGVPADQAVMIGDAPLRDIAAAAEVGARSCWIAAGRIWPASLPPPDWSIPDVLALPPLLP